MLQVFFFFCVIQVFVNQVILFGFVSLLRFKFDIVLIIDNANIYLTSITHVSNQEKDEDNSDVFKRDCGSYLFKGVVFIREGPLFVLI